MDIYTATEEAYKRGYEAGLKAANRPTPRILTAEEVRRTEGKPVWVELRSPKKDWQLCLVYGIVSTDTFYPYLITVREDSGIAWGRAWEDYNRLRFDTIHSGWRCWSSQPTQEQRVLTEWR